jgi:hypothetical protein
MSWFTIRKSDDRVLGWVRSSGATPADTAELRYISQQFDQALALYNQLENEMLAEGREVEIFLQDATFVKAAETRPLVSIEANKTIVDADGVDSVILTVTRLDNPTFSGNPRVQFGDKYLRFDFTNGVATKTVRSRTSGILTFANNPRFRVQDPISIEFVE